MKAQTELRVIGKKVSTFEKKTTISHLIIASDEKDKNDFFIDPTVFNAKFEKHLPLKFMEPFIGIVDVRPGKDWSMNIKLLSVTLPNGEVLDCTGNDEE